MALVLMDECCASITGMLKGKGVTMSNGYDSVVVNGIRLFKEQGITNWAKLMNVGELDMWSGKKCAAGQVFRFRAAERATQDLNVNRCGCCDYNGYDFACELIGDQDSSEFGFCPDGRYGSTEELVDAWKRAVAAAL